MSPKLIKFFKGFVYAQNGIYHGANGRNMKVHLFVAFLVVLFSLLLGISPLEWFIVLICIASVISAELINSAIEEICDLVRDRLHLDYSATTHARDLAAGAVLVLSLSSAIIGLIIFIPKLIGIFLF